MSTTSEKYLWKTAHDFNYTSPGFLTLILVVTNCDRRVTAYTYLVRHRDPARRRWYWPLERPRHWKTPLCYRCPCPEIEPGQREEVPGPSHTVYRGSSLRNTDVAILKHSSEITLSSCLHDLCSFCSGIRAVTFV